jgi:hypothetical protein
MRSGIFALAATALLCTLMAPQAASARMGGGGSHGGMSGAHAAPMSGGFRGGMTGGFHAAPTAGFRSSPVVARPFVVHNNFAFRHHAFFDRRFAFRHHRFRHFRNGFFVASIADDSCFIVRRVWTPWGWRWRHVWVCG